MADAQLSARATATEEDSIGAENEYGLQDLARLPLLEQVHRLFHAIQHKYPYKEVHTTTETSKLNLKLSLMHQMRQVGGQLPPVDPAMAVKSDPYLKMLQQRSLRSAGPVVTGEDGAALPKHPNSAYVAPAQVPHYTQVKPKFKPRWQVAEGEFFEKICVCGVKHDTGKKGKKASLMLHTISSMMSTFGDSTQSCVTAVEEVQALGSQRFVAYRAGWYSLLQTLVEIFEEEAIYYGRWREFRGETKHEENELEDVEEEELAEELDLFAVSETDDVFNEAFLVRCLELMGLENPSLFLLTQILGQMQERIRFADERTKKMDWAIYDVFARGRKLNFMNNKAQQFREWLGLGKISRASLEFLNFVAYHKYDASTIFTADLLTNFSILDVLALAGHVDVVEWLAAHRDEGGTKYAMNFAVWYGKAQMVHWLYQHRSEGCSIHAMVFAAKRGGLELLKWLFEHKEELLSPDAEDSSPLIMDHAAEHGHLDVVQWLHDNTTGGCTTDAMNGAARGGYLEIVEFLHEHRSEGCTNNAMDGAARGGTWKW
ncbi:Ankyrin repeat-containing domain [Phytophthora cactorum]|nr:Ankyrin repeat-containing domain [Phytophthora cactorum]